MDLEENTWYWISHPHEGDIFYPIKSIGMNIVILDGARVHKDTIGDVHWHKAVMPDA